MKKVILALLFFLSVQAVQAQEGKRVLDLKEVIQLALKNSRRAKQNETSLQFGYWRYRVYQANFNPSLNLDGVFPNRTNSVERITLPSGAIRFTGIDQLDSDLGLGLVQSLPWTNTTVSLRTSLSRNENFLLPDSVESVSYSGVPLSIRVSQPLFAVNPFKWDKKIQPLEYDQNKREFAQTQEQIAVEATRFFFSLLESQIDLQIAQQNLKTNNEVYRIEEGRYNIGTTTEDQLLQTEINLLNSRRDAQQAELDVQTRSLDLRSYIGLTDDVEIELLLPEEIPDMIINADDALRYARENRSDYLDYQIRRLNAERGIAEAKAQRFDASITAIFGLNDNGSSISDIYDEPNNQSIFRLQFNLPILDGGRNRARMGQARASKALTEFQVEQDRIAFEQSVQTAVRNFDQIKGAIEISKKRDVIAQKRFEISNNRYLIGKIDILQYPNALNDKDAAKQGYISALRQYWNAYYEMRNLTLYDFEYKARLFNPLLEFDPKKGIIERAETEKKKKKKDDQ